MKGTTHDGAHGTLHCAMMIHNDLHIHNNIPMQSFPCMRGLVCSSPHGFDWSWMAIFKMKIPSTLKIVRAVSADENSVGPKCGSHYLGLRVMDG